MDTFATAPPSSTAADNAAAAAAASFPCVPELFARRVAALPEATALVTETESVSYGDLNQRADHLARFLVARGVGLESLVGVCLDRTIDMVVALLGILKAGAAYVPLDPKYPAHRLEMMVADAQLQLLVTRESLASIVSYGNLPVLCLDTERERIAALADTEESSLANSTAPVRSENAAYVIYTSGSTGRPKGVVIPHGALANYTAAATAAYRLTPEDRVLQFSSISFDGSIEEIFPILTCGGTLVLRTDAMLDSAAAFFAQCAAWSVTTLCLPTAFWHELAVAVESGVATPPASLRTVVIGGERVLPERVAGWLSRAGDAVRLVNSYGPTESTVVATVCDLTRENAAISPIGRPLNGVEALVLDAAMQPAPAGAPGELHLGGAQLARGYLRRDELTAEKFVPHPFRPGARLYRTGDLARLLPDGNIEFLGRADDQVKLRGFRVEPGEIEATLRGHPAVADAIVILGEDGSGEKKLAAYLVARPGVATPAPTPREMRDFLRSKLPDYMVPADFVALAAFPRTPNGKIDRRALPAPDPESRQSDPAFASPESDVERRLAGIWEEVLGRGTVGCDDDFFDLGGHSILTVRLFGLIHREFGRSLPLATLLTHRTVRALAGLLEVKNLGGSNGDGAAAARSRPSMVAPIQPLGRKPPLFCIHAGDGGIFFYRDLAARLGTERPLYGIEASWLNGSDSRPQENTIEAVARQYLSQIKAVQRVGPCHLAGFSFGGIVVYEMACQLRAAGEEVGVLALFDTCNPACPPQRLTLAERVRRNREAMAGRSLAGKAGHLARRFRGKVVAVSSRERENVRELAARFLKSTGHDLPLDWRHLATRREQLNSMDHYRPHPYPGAMNLFVAAKAYDGYACPPNLGWDGLPATLRVFTVPGSHETILKEPNVGVIARRMQHHLDSTER